MTFLHSSIHILAKLIRSLLFEQDFPVVDQFGLSGVTIDNQWPIACGGCQNEGNKNCYLIDYNMTGWEALSESRCLASRFLIQGYFHYNLNLADFQIL